MYKKWFIIFFVLIISAGRLFAQNAQIIQGMKKAVIPIVSPDKATILGTGLLVSNKEYDSVYIITNAHVLDAYNCYQASKESWEIINSTDVICRMDIKDITEYYSVKISSYNRNLDIAILKAPDNKSKKIINSCIDYNMFATEADIIEGEEVLVIGFPLGIGQEYQNFPVSKRGMVAYSDNKNTNSFLLDVIINHGNSGSPVFGKSSNKIIYLGTVVGFKTDTTKLFDENGRLVATLPYNAGLASIIKATKIKGILDSLGK